MKKQQNQTRLIEIFKYLWDNTDKTQYVTIVELQEYLRSLGLNPDRKTITKDIEMLNSIGCFDISCRRSIQNQYYISRRYFNESDVKMLCDAIRSFYFISDTNAKEIISCLETFVGPSERTNIYSPTFVDASVKTKNTNVIKNATKIAKAISDKKKIRFKYFDYTVEGKKEHKGKKYLVSPYAMIIDDGKYYFAGTEDEERIVKTFRIDKLDTLMITTFDTTPPPKSFSVKKLTMNTRMYSGYESNVQLYCQKEAMYGIVDKFGTKVNTEKVDDEHFTTTVTTNISPTFFGWVIGYGGKIKIIGPKQVVDDFKNKIKKCL